VGTQSVGTQSAGTQSVDAQSGRDEISSFPLEFVFENCLNLSSLPDWTHERLYHDTRFPRQ